VPEANPYKPPAATVRDPPRPPRSPTFAILVGIGIDLGGALASSAVVATLYTLMLVAQGRSVMEFDPRQTWFGVVGVLTGGACSFLGGYVCARLVRRNERRVTAMMATIVMASSVALALSVALQIDALSMLSWTWSIARLVATFLLVLAGGELGRRRNLVDVRTGAATAV
jgi:peptidoglycan/LPS O-acetylase OafA/YrhL